MKCRKCKKAEATIDWNIAFYDMDDDGKHKYAVVEYCEPCLQIMKQELSEMIDQPVRVTMGVSIDDVYMIRGTPIMVCTDHCV